MSLKSFAFTVLLAIGLSLPATAEASTPLEERTFFRPVRVGLCAGIAPDCPFFGLKTEFSTKYVGASVTMTLGLAGSLKVYPGMDYHSEKVSIRPYVEGSAGSWWGTKLRGGGVGTDIHLLQSKRLLLQPSVSVFESCYPPHGGPGGYTCGVKAGGSLSVMAAF